MKPQQTSGLFRVPDAANPSAVGRWQARSVVASRDGIVAAESPLAAQAGAAVLASGGHAVDAAVAANAVMTVVAPHSNGIGGDLFAMVYEAATGTISGLNASGWSPAGISAEWLRSRGISAMPEHGVHTITVPGAVDGWRQLLNRFGRKKLQYVLEPAIQLAENGFPVTEWSAGRWAAGQSVIAGEPEAARVFLPNGRAPRFQEVFTNRDLARTMRQIAVAGADVFYRGDIARRIVECCSERGGAIGLADLAEFSSEWVEPVSTTYREWTVCELPPNGVGIAALQMLNLMENFPLAQIGHNTADFLHILIEAKKLAYADMLCYVCDPRCSRAPLVELLSKSYARLRSKRINMNKACPCSEPGEPSVAGGDTIYLAAVDRDGNMVSLIQSNYGMFGSGLVPRQTGFALQNRGNLFSLDRAHPNVLAGRKRPLHTIIPALLCKEGVRIAFGIQGGWSQSQAHAQFVSNIADYSMNIQAALEAPRFTKLTFTGCDVQMENRIAPEVRAELALRGHEIQLLGPFSDVVGGGQAVMRDYVNGVNFGGSDPRKDGEAIPAPPLL